jgi:hypothetical protein
MRPIVDPAASTAKLPTPANDVEAVMARVVMPIGDEEAALWDQVVESRARKAA